MHLGIRLVELRLHVLVLEFFMRFFSQSLYTLVKCHSVLIRFINSRFMVLIPLNFQPIHSLILCFSLNPGW